MNKQQNWYNFVLYVKAKHMILKLQSRNTKREQESENVC